MTKKSIFRDQFSWKVSNFSHARSYFRSKAQRKTRFPLVLCSLIRNFAQNLCENGLHLGKEQALCTRFAPSLAHAFRKGCRSFCCSTFRERTATSNKEINEQTYYRRSMRSIAQTTPLGNRGCRRPVHGNGTGSVLFLCPYR